MLELWQSVLDKIRPKISEVNYNNWFKDIKPLAVDNREIRLSVPNRFIKDWLSDYYTDVIRDELSNISGQEMRVLWECDGREPEVHNVVNGEQGDRTEPLVTSVVRAPICEPLNPRYRFDRFVVGTNNQFAHAACRSVADLPGAHYNPLFIYGGVGLGKTHLLNAVGLALQDTHPDTRILYVGSERFVNELINSIRFDKMGDFRRKYRESCDVLLMDDVQFLAGKERSQEEFFHTFNCLYDNQKQIVVTSDRLPKDIGIEERIRSRFEWGLIADIQPPDLETRIAILKKKADSDRIQLPDDAATYLAQQVRSNVRELEGSLIRLSAYASLNAKPITVELVQEILKNIVRDPEQRCSIEAVQKLVADYYQIKVAEMKSARRMKHLAVPRQIAMYLCKKHIKSSFPEIGQKFGGKDHTTVIHACRKIDGEIKSNPRMRDDVEFLEKSLIN